MLAATSAISAAATRAVKRPERCGGCGGCWAKRGVGLTIGTPLYSFSIDGERGCFGFVHFRQFTQKDCPGAGTTTSKPYVETSSLENAADCSGSPWTRNTLRSDGTKGLIHSISSR